MNKKIIAFVLAVAFTASVVSPVGAVTLEELQTLYNDLLAKYDLLFAQVGQATGAAAVCFDADLQQGMTSDDVKDLQIKLGVTPTSGYFGPITLAAVKTFQTANGIINTGYVGPLTRGALNALYCTPVVPSTLPEGCTSTVGFSTTTGLSCSAAVSYPEGCTSTVGFSPTTGLSCAGTVVSYPEGCTSAVGFSPTTGLSCATTTTVAAVVEGSIEVSTSGTFVEPTLYWDDENKPVLAFEIKAKNSVMTIKRVDLQLTGTSILPWKVFQTISLYEGSNLVKSIVPVKADYIENTYAADYTLRFSGLDTAIAKDATKTFVFKADVFETPSNYADYTTINLPASGIRAVDSAGINQYGPSAAGTITVATAIYDTATAAAIVGSVNASSPTEGFIIGNASSVVSNQDLLKVDLKSTGAATTLKTLTIAVTGHAYASAIKLYDGDTLLSSKASGAAPSFDNLEVAIAKDATKVLTIKADIKPITTEGNVILAVLTADATDVVAVDSSENAASVSGGAITGKDMHLYIVAPVLSLTSVTGAKTDPETGASTYDGVIKFSVTASGGTLYVNAEDATGIGIEGVDSDAVAASSSYTFVSSADKTDSGGGVVYYTIPSAASKTFTVSSHSSGNDGFTYFSLSRLLWTSSSTLAGTVTTSSLDDLDWGWEDYMTDSTYLEAS